MRAHRSTRTDVKRFSTQAVAAIALAAGILACAQAHDGPRESGATAATVTPTVTGPRVVLPSGRAISVEIARTDEEHAQGLMYRASMPAGNGMIFLFDALEIRPFWMKNCHFPLDLVYAKKDGTVVDVLRDVPPCAADPCPSYPPHAAADTVIEVNAGVAPANGVVAGAKLRYLDVSGR